MDSFNDSFTTVSKNETSEKENLTAILRSEIEKVLGGTLEGAFELKGGLGLIVTIRKDNKPYALVIQRPTNGFNPAKDTDIYITEGIGK